VEGSLTVGTLGATLTVSSDWGAGYCADVSVKNSGSSAALWKVTIQLNQAKLTQHWSSHVTTSGSSAVFAGLDYNVRVAPGAAMSFGFCAEGTGARASITGISGGGTSPAPTSTATAPAPTATQAPPPPSGPRANRCKTSRSAAGFVHPGHHDTCSELQGVAKEIAAGNAYRRARFERLFTLRAKVTTAAGAAVEVAFVPRSAGVPANYSPEYVAFPPITKDAMQFPPHTRQYQRATADAQACYANALAYAYTSDTDKDSWRHRDNALRVLDTWSQLRFPDQATLDGGRWWVVGQYSLEASWWGTLMVRCAELMKSVFPEYRQLPSEDWKRRAFSKFDSMVAGELTRGLARIAWPKVGGNWGGSALEGTIAAAVYLEDRALFDDAKRRYFQAMQPATASYNPNTFYEMPGKYASNQDNCRDNGHAGYVANGWFGAALQLYTQAGGFDAGHVWGAEKNPLTVQNAILFQSYEYISLIANGTHLAALPRPVTMVNTQTACSRGAGWPAADGKRCCVQDGWMVPGLESVLRVWERLNADRSREQAAALPELAETRRYMQSQYCDTLTRYDQAWGLGPLRHGKAGWCK
jgi:hypothetical protein